MTTDIKTRIDALKPPPAPPGGAATTAAPSPDDPRRLLPMLIDLAAEVHVAIRAMEQTAVATNAAVVRLQHELPVTCRQAAREEVQPMRQQLTGQRTELETLTSHVAHAAATSDDCSGTLRGLCFVIGSVGLALLVAFIRGLC